ncbi:hypothetical protein SAMN04488057_105278 [Cyclobacterium lianum]|uniref:Uncharacterized protein n=1 Tax=Cyclobacterium lianum TaxID=388280 RepID=A0A1M7NGM8_9BACT|nr:hypothetical protein [Cyclobacterium lianum]SHN02383.1 hypothetical protein SAMN04488057_105278 [Cyclobacterium lianum]
MNPMLGKFAALSGRNNNNRVGKPLENAQKLTGFSSLLLEMATMKKSPTKPSFDLTLFELNELSQVTVMGCFSDLS